MDAAIAKLTPENVKFALTCLYALAGAPKGAACATAHRAPAACCARWRIGCQRARARSKLTASSFPPAALGLGNKAFASDFKLPAFIAVGSGVAELAGAAMMHKGGEFLSHGVLVLVVVMGGAVMAMLRTTPAAALFPATFTYGLWYVLAAAKQAQPPIFAAAFAAGVLGNLVFTKGGKSTPAKAAGKKATAKKAK